MERKSGFIQIGNYFFNIQKIESIKVDDNQNITIFMENRETIIHNYQGWPKERILGSLDMLLCGTRDLHDFI